MADEGNVNFIDNIITTLLLKSDIQSIDLAYTSAHALIGSVTGDKIFVETYKGRLSADIICLVIGETGIEKTLMHDPVYEVIKKLNLLIPANFTTSSLPFYFDQRKYEEITDENGKVTDRRPNGYKYPNYGLVFWDEASGQFSEAKSKDYKAGIIEMISEVYNHKLKANFVKESNKCVTDPQQPYISLLGNMVPKYFSQIPELFFVQGIAGRMHWCYVVPPPPTPKEQQKDWNDLSNLNTYNQQLDEITEKLRILDKQLHSRNTPFLVHLDNGANRLIKEFKYQTEIKWFSSLSNNPFGWDFQYFKRLPEMACKAALRYAVGRYVDDISKLTTITSSEMVRGMQFALKSSQALEILFTLKIGYGQKAPPEFRAQNALMNAKNGMLTNKQWQKLSGIASPNDWQKVRDKLILEGKAIEVDKKRILDEDERLRLGVSTPAKVYKFNISHSYKE